ncbi:MAG TPA: HEAT repeat domain-containing protein, partial [Spirochaetota bacterium]|nr:HEAT repeat domain-containing protein [Spirochaetota bacterium]
MSLNELKLQLNSIRNGCEYKELFDFAGKLMEQNSKEYLDFHYEIIRDTDIEGRVYDFLCREFRNRRNEGENYLLDKIKSESDDYVKASVLQILGSYRYAERKDETADLARDLLTSDVSVLRCRALWVLGWIGAPDDLEAISKALYNDTDEDNRCWAATAMMQMFFD